MSSKYVFYAMEAETGNPLRKSVLIGLADNTDNDGVCFPSYQHIADKMEMSRRTVMIHVEALEKMGFISKETRHLPTGKNRSNVYRLMLNGSKNPINKVIHSSESPAPVTSESPALGGESPAPLSGESPAPITCHSFNQSLNHTEITHARGVTLIPENFGIDETVKFRLQAAGVKLPVAEFLLVEFVNQNISTGWTSFDWAAHLVSYCKKNEWRYKKHEQSARREQELPKQAESRATRQHNRNKRLYAEAIAREQGDTSVREVSGEVYPSLDVGS